MIWPNCEHNMTKFSSKNSWVQPIEKTRGCNRLKSYVRFVKDFKSVKLSMMTCFWETGYRYHFWNDQYFKIPLFDVETWAGNVCSAWKHGRLIVGNHILTLNMRRRTWASVTSSRRPQFFERLAPPRQNVILSSVNICLPFSFGHRRGNTFSG